MTDDPGGLAELAEPRRTARWVAIPVAFVLAAFVLVLATRSDDDSAPSSRLVGELAPVTQGTALDGSQFDLDDHAGEWVVVNFFSTTCQPCVIEHPELIEFAEAGAADGSASVVSIAFGDTEQNIASFFERNGGDWPVIVEDASPLSVRYGVLKVPESFIVAPNGVVFARFTGGVTKADLDGVIERATSP